MAETTNLATQRAQGEAAERSATEIRQDIAAKRETISETVDKLSNRLHQTLDWREYVADYPVASLGVAAGIGFLVAGIFKHRPTPQERIVDALAELTEDLTGRVSDIAGSALKKKLVSSKTVKAAITGVITKAAMDYAKKQVGTRLLHADNRDRNEQSVYQREQAGQEFQNKRLL